MNVRQAPSAKYSALSSTCASTITQLVMVPCETVKIQLQIFQKATTNGDGPLMNSLKFIYRHEGISGFWRGYFVSLSCSLPSCAIYYSVFETLRKYLYKECENHKFFTPFVPAVAGSCAQIFTCLTTSPIDRFRTQYWADRNASISTVLKRTAAEVRQHGFLSLYQGIRPLIVRDVCFASIYWTVYEKLRHVTSSLGWTPFNQNLVSASVGGMLTAAIVTPFDLVKTRQQVLSTRESIYASLREIGRDEGIRGLFRGMTPRVFQSIPTMSVMMIVYDGLNRFFLQRQLMHDVVS